MKNYVAHGAIPAGEATFFEGVRAFPAGHLAEVPLDRTVAVQPRPYWRLSPSLRQLPYEEACRATRELFESSIRMHLRSDVPVGACLSGGLDSSAIVCTIRKLEGDSPLHTFTAANSEDAYDETAWADCVSRRVGAKAHHVKPSEEGFLADLERLVWHHEEPIAGTSIYAQWLVMRSAREAGIPVLLDGQGADELFCGYKKYYPIHLMSLMARGHVGPALHQAWMLARHGDRGYARWWEGIRYLPKRLRPDLAMLREILGEDGCEWLSAFPSAPRGRTPLEMQVLDLTSTSVPALLKIEDRNSMAWSIESRVPYLDHELAQFALALPVEHKLRNGRTKSVLRSAMSGVVPDPVLDRRDKFNFFAPFSSWMRGDLGARLCEEVSESAFVNELFRTSALVGRWRTRGGSTSEIECSYLFRLGMLAIWHKVFQKRAAGGSRSEVEVAAEVVS